MKQGSPSEKQRIAGLKSRHRRQGEHFGGKKVWKCIRDMQFGRRGRVPTRVVAICDERGEPCSTPTEQHQCWRRHFNKVLNVRSQFDGAELAEVRQRVTDADLGTVPTLAEVAKSLGKQKNGKAPGSSKIMPEMLKAGGRVEEFTGIIADLVHRIWEERRVPKEWVDSILILIPKKGNLRRYDNWHGISLLEVMGKVVARIIQGRLQKLAERELPESQCGFRKDAAVRTWFLLPGNSLRQLLNIKLSSSSSLLI